MDRRPFITGAASAAAVACSRVATSPPSARLHPGLVTKRRPVQASVAGMDPETSPRVED